MTPKKGTLESGVKILYADQLSVGLLINSDTNRPGKTANQS